MHLVHIQLQRCMFMRYHNGLYENMNPALNLEKQNKLFFLDAKSFLNFLYILTDQSQYSSIQGSCPGLTHGQKFGISYVEEKHETHEGLSLHHPESQRHSVIVISNPTTIHSINADESDSSNNILGRNDESKTLMPVTDEKDVNASSQDEMQEVQDTRRAYTPL